MDGRHIVVLTCVDGALRAKPAGRCREVRRAIRDLIDTGIAVVLASHHSAAELRAIQADLGLVAPFICGNGQALHVPCGYFGTDGAIDPHGRDWDVVEFTPASLEDAIDRLLWLYRQAGASPLLVGVGCQWPDHLLLRHVDVPVVVRNAALDQRQLCERFPDAYVTTTDGPDGWREAILGRA